MFYRFCAEYGIDSNSINFSHENILVPQRLGNIAIEDILSEEDSTIFLECCLEKTFALTAHADTAIFFSIAGGRKTMGASLSIAAQYYGRRQDRMYHVLVHSDFEYNPNFYYPPKIPQVIELRDSKGEKIFKSTEYATVSLVNLPFFSVRENLTKDMLEKPAQPQDLIRLLERTATPHLRVHIQKCEIEWGGKCVKLPVAHMALYLFFAQRNIQGQTYLEMPQITNLSSEIAAIYHKVNSYQPFKESALSDTGITAPTAENVRSYISKIHKKIEHNFGSKTFEKIKIASIGKKPDTKYGIPIDSKYIKIIE